MIVPVASVLGVGSFEITTLVALASARESQDTPAIDLALKRLFGMVHEWLTAKAALWGQD